MYSVYILACADGTLYTGITTDVARRVGEHNTSSLGAKYTRVRRPVKMIYARDFVSRSLASREEARIKGLSRSAKISLVKEGKRKKNDTVDPLTFSR